MRIALAATMMIVNACSGVALNTRVADVPEARAAMAASVFPGRTTETELVTRWGQPVQKIRDGAQTEFVYRNMFSPPGAPPVFGDSANYVIVTFQYGIATGVRTSDEIDCRGTFAPRPPNYGFDNPTEVRLVGRCAPDYPPTFWDHAAAAVTDALADLTGKDASDRTGAGAGDAGAGLVMSDDGAAGGGKAGGPK